MEPIHELLLTESEIQALQKILGYFLVHTSDDVFSVMGKLDDIIGSDFISYDDVVFSKTDDSGCVIKQYKHKNFTIAFKE